MTTDLETAQNVEAGEQKLGLIWAAMLLAPVVYAVLAMLVAPTAKVTIDRELRTWIMIFLSMTAGLHVLTTLLLRQALAALSKARYSTYCILRWALMEGIGIYGLVLALLGVGIGITAFFFAVSLLMLGAARPGPADRAVFVAQFR